MRNLTIGILAFAALARASAASAADLDYDVLRGADYEPEATPLIDWSGAYIGGHGGYSAEALGRRSIFQSVLEGYFSSNSINQNYTSSSLTSLTNGHANSAGYGAFAGYNIQLDDVVIGFEADYSHFSDSYSSEYNIGRMYETDSGMSEAEILTGKSTTAVRDYGSLRARAGYAIGNFLPFVTGGLAVGQVSVTDTVAVQSFGFSAKTYAENQANPTAQLPVYNHGYISFNTHHPAVNSSPNNEPQTIAANAKTLSVATHSKTLGGAVFGGGIDYALTSNFLLRGEYQYIVFNDFNGHAANISTIRGGAALKF